MTSEALRTGVSPRPYAPLSPLKRSEPFLNAVPCRHRSTMSSPCLVGKRGFPDLSFSGTTQKMLGDTCCVVGIDFGTTGTGYAYSFSEPGSEIVIYNRTPGEQDQTGRKAPSVILLSADGKFIAFGRRARELHEEGTCPDALFFENYKMNLAEDLNEVTQAKAVNGKTLPLLRVIAETLAFVKRDALEEVNISQVRSKPIQVHEIQWVVTVPAIWEDKAKGLMRKAATQAGIIHSVESENFQLALEPEAACMACELNGTQINVGSSFMVLDCGGGTVDITRHTMRCTDPWTVEELALPSGGAWGSTYVDAQFKEFVKTLIGTEAFNRFEKSGSDRTELMNAWDNKKGSFRDSQPGPTVINFHSALTPEFFSTECKSQKQRLADLVEAYNRRQASLKLETKGETRLAIPLTTMKKFFNAVIDPIVNHVEECLKEPPLDHILLVGGFAESKVLQARLEKAFPGMVVKPHNPGLAVVKGAVAFALKGGSQISSRLARYTYGVQFQEDYDPVRRPEHRGKRLCQGIRDGKSFEYLPNIFHTLVRRGDRIMTQDRKTTEFVQQLDKDSGVLKILRTSQPDVRFSDDEGVREIGEFQVSMKRGESGCLSIEFGSTEILAMATNITTGASTPASLQYNFSDL